MNPSTGFIWAIIAPVIVTICINIGLFVMAAIVMWRHKKKKAGKMNKKQVKNWLKALVSLVVIMGLTWIFGVLIVEVDALLPLAYIYTILVAFQGLWILLIFVAFPRQVRDEYLKLFKGSTKSSDTLSKYSAAGNNSVRSIVSAAVYLRLEGGEREREREREREGGREGGREGVVSMFQCVSMFCTFFSQQNGQLELYKKYSTRYNAQRGSTADAS